MDVETVCGPGTLTAGGFELGVLATQAAIRIEVMT
jgi:hypothetical protein